MGDNSQKKNRFRQKDVAVICTIFLISCLYFLSYFNYGMNIWDEGVPLNGALRMFQGERPIRDFFAYPPGRYILYYLSMKIGGLHVSSPRILQAFLSAFFATLIWLIGRKAGLKKSAIIPWVIYLLTPMYYYYRFFSFSLVLMIISLALQLKPLTYLNTIISGVLALLICWFRFELGIILLALFPFLMVINWRLKDNRPNMINALPSFILYAGQISLVLYTGGIKSWLHYVGLCTNTFSGGFKGMSLSWPPLFSFQYLQNNNYFSLFQDSLFYVTGIILLLSGLSIILSKQFNAWRTAIVITGFIGFGLVIWRTGFGNLLRCFPPISILSVWLITRNKTYQGIKYIVGTFFFVGLLLDSLIKNPHIYQSIGVIKSDNVLLSHPRYSAKVFASECRQMSELISGLEQLKTMQYQTMMTLPFHPLLNFITNLQNTSYFEWLLPGMLTHPIYYQDMLEEVSQHAPDIFLINDIPFDDEESRRFSKQYPELMMWILSDYYRWERAAGFDIYRRKPKDSPLLLHDFSDAVAHAVGINTILQIQGLVEDKSEILVQECGSEIQFEISPLNDTVLYCVVLFESSLFSEDCSLRAEIRINDIPVSTIEYDRNENYAFLAVPILMRYDEATRLDLVTSCSTGCSDGRVIWLKPVFLELELSNWYIDMYCVLP